MPQLPRVGDVLGRYRVDDQIGFGGMGVVYGATDLDLGRRVAVKVLSAELGGSGEFLQRFEREAALLARLASPHVIGVYDYGEHDGNPYIVTQYVGGGDLGDLLRARGPMPPTLALDVCAQIADALSDTHRLGVIHRDVKPSNVLLRDPDAATLTAYLCDFGIARTSTDGLTSAGSVSGTWAYLAPEVAMGEPATPRSDIYALGCLLWAALTGRPPYAGSDVEMALAHQRAPIAQLGAATPFLADLDEILRRCLAKDPEERYADADSLRGALLASAADPSAPRAPLRGRPAASSAPSSTTRSTPIPRPHRRRTTALVATVTAVAVIGGGIALGVTRPWESEASQAATDGRSISPSPSGSGSGSPTPTPTPSKSALVHGRPVQGDLNADGYGDVMVTRDSGSDTAPGPEDVRLTWDSTGTSLKQVQTIRNNSLPSFDLIAADFDGDGRIEVAQIHPAKSKRKNPPDVVTARLTSGGTYRAPVATSFGKASEFQIAGAADVNGDGRDDLLTIATTYDEKSGEATGDATLSAELTSKSHVPGKLHKIATVRLGWPAWRLPTLHFADITGDGRDDIIVSEDAEMTGDGGTRITVVPSTRSGYGPPESTTYRDDWSDVMTGDIDGDGVPELVATTEGGAVGYAKYDGGLRPFRTWGVPSGASIYVHGFDTMSDVNGDGRDDLVSGGWNKAQDTFVIEVTLATRHRGLAQTKVWAKWADSYERDTYVDLVSNVVFI